MTDFEKFIQGQFTQVRDVVEKKNVDTSSDDEAEALKVEKKIKKKKRRPNPADLRPINSKTTSI